MTTTTFHSSLGDDMASYLELKRAVGFKGKNIEKILRLFDRFLARRFPNTSDLSLPILEAWLTEPATLTAATRQLRLTTVRQLCLYRRRRLPDAYVPDRQNAWKIWPRRLRYKPHIFTIDEIKRLLRAALKLSPYRDNPHRAQTFFNLLLLLYGTGMRISEAHALRVGDVNWAEGTLLIRESKFFKTRLVPVKRDLLESLQGYQTLCGLAKGTNSLDRPFFQRERGRTYGLEGLQKVGIHLLRSAAIKPTTPRVGPRLHDLRHTFAVRCIERWYAEGRDVQNLLPRLATYMGHKDLRSTQYYLTITDVILRHASDRFERACAPGRGA
ncbi:MAG: tyrosine-type recombinase/integrase [Candidatus Hydrogenedentes bacterium]|nr:tyrosine-type recombinase/integrase [Candidatus Hydrogenedentota bacterium]